MLASVTTLWAVRLWTCVRNKQWLRLSLLRRQSDHTEGEVPVDCCQLQVGVHTAPSHWYSLWPGLSCCSVLHWELRIEWQQRVYVRNKQWLRLSLFRRQSDHTEGEVPVDCCQLHVGVHTAPSQWYSFWPGLSCCSVLHWELRIEWQQGCLSGDDCTQSRVYEYMSSNGPCQRLKLLPLRTCFTWERRCLRTEVASRTTIWLNFCDIIDSFSISVRLSTVGMNNVTITSAHVVSSQSTSFIDTITSFLTKNHCRL